MMRLWQWQVATAAIALLLWAVSPQQFEVVLYKTGLVTLGVVLAYWVDRSLFGRIPHGAIVPNVLTAARFVARALIVVGIVLGLTLGI
jgi:hypothetical protein